MTGTLYIDGTDAYTAYGVYVVEGGWNELLSWPALKEVETNDWQEEDGIEADLSAPVLNTRDLTMRFAIADMSLYDGFLAKLADRAYHVFNCVAIGRSFTLRLVSYSSLEIAEKLGLLAVRFADDFPLLNYTYQAPVETGVPDSGYAIDEVSLADYGVRVLQGSLEEVRCGSEVKPAMLRNIKTQQGAIYDSGAPVHFKAKDVRLACLLRAGSLTTMWRNYLALLHDLTQPGERMLYVDALGVSYSCMYKGCSVRSFAPASEVWLTFDLELRLLGGVEESYISGCLASESGIFISGLGPRSYVQQGLIFQLDGLVKGVNAGTWTDLVQGIVLDKIGNPQPLSDGWQFSDGNYFHTYEYLGELINNNLPQPKNATIEIVYTGDINNALALGNQSFVIGKYNAFYILTSAFAPRNTTGIANIPSEGKHILSCASVSINANKGVVDKADIIMTTQDYWTGYGNEMFIGARAKNLSQSIQASNCAIHAIRVYNRTLTDEEIFANQTIDIKRFGIEL